MRFSVITVTYNATRYLEQTLRSVAEQDFTDYEHIIWDGGSSDQTLEIARNFSHVKIYEGKDQGIADAMNRGAQYAQGDYLLHLHADDFLAHSRALSMVDRFLRLHPHIDWLYGRLNIIGSEEDPIRTTPYEPFTFKRLRRYNFISHPAVFVKRTLFNAVGGFRDLKYCMDYDLWLRLASHSSPYALSTVLSCFREHTHSLSTSKPLEVADEAHLVRTCYVKNLYEQCRSYSTWKKRRRHLLK